MRSLISRLPLVRDIVLQIYNDRFLLVPRQNPERQFPEFNQTKHISPSVKLPKIILSESQCELYSLKVTIVYNL